MRSDVARAPHLEAEMAAATVRDGSTNSAFDWTATVAALETTGLVRELARHCALHSFNGRILELTLASQYENLRSERQVKGLEQALRKILQQEVVVRFSAGSATLGQTPAQQTSEAATARQAAAARQIEQDPNVQSLQRQFGATIERVSAKDT
jgi:DNA polymerase-3 subunit gamma/tau